MTNPIDEIFVNDSYGAVFSWTKPTEANPNVSEDANPSSATFSVVRARTGQALSLDDTSATVSGNDTTCVVPAGVLNRAGNYSLYCTAVFPDGTTLTRSREFRVRAKNGT